jgi:hypothetical protein
MLEISDNNNLPVAIQRGGKMPAMIARIVKDRVYGEDVFFVRFYHTVQDILDGNPANVDGKCQECSDVIPDEDCMIYFEDRKIIEKLTGGKG